MKFKSDILLISLILFTTLKRSYSWCEKQNYFMSTLTCSEISDLKRSDIANETLLNLSLDNKNFNSEMMNLENNKEEINTQNIVVLEIKDSLKHNPNTNAYINFNNLKVLRLSDNNITELVSDIFKNNHQLTDLYLGKNQIQKIGSCAFCNLSKLEILKLQDNEISEVSGEWFGDLSSYSNNLLLNLSSNRIFKINDAAFKSVNIFQLHLSKNQLTDFNAKKYQLNARLYVLDLDYNHLTSITSDSFFGLYRLNTLNLAFNNIRYIEEGGFKHCPHLNTLSLGHNSIRVLDANILPSEGLDLTILYLDNNRLNFLTTHLLNRLFNHTYESFYKSNIKIQNNPWTCPCLKVINKWLHDHQVNNDCDNSYYQEKQICVIPENPSKCIYSANPEYYEQFQNSHSSIPSSYCIYSKSETWGANGVLLYNYTFHRMQRD